MKRRQFLSSAVTPVFTNALLSASGAILLTSFWFAFRVTGYVGMCVITLLLVIGHSGLRVVRKASFSQQAVHAPAVRATLKVLDTLAIAVAGAYVLRCYERGIDPWILGIVSVGLVISTFSRGLREP